MARFMDLIDSGDHESAAFLLADDTRYYSLGNYYSDDVPWGDRRWDFIGRSPEEVIAYWGWGHVRHAHLPRTLDGLPVRSIHASPEVQGSLLSAHMMANLDIEVDMDGGIATGRSYMFGYQATSSLPLQPTHVVRMRDTWERHRETWEWTERFNVQFWFEQMSGHSARSTDAAGSRRGSWNPTDTLGLESPGQTPAQRAPEPSRGFAPGSVRSNRHLPPGAASMKGNGDLKTKLSDRIQIENTLSRFYDHFDAGRFRDASELLAPDATYYASFFTARGPTELCEFWQRNVILHHGGTPQTAHLSTNLDIEIDEGTGTATASSYVVCFQCLPDFPLQATHVVRCIDRFSEEDDAWSWRERRILPYLYRETSRHARKHNRPGPWDPAVIPPGNS
jgi:hypothetical protein